MSVSWTAPSSSPACKKCQDDFEKALERLKEDKQTDIERARKDRDKALSDAQDDFLIAVAAAQAGFYACLGVGAFFGPIGAGVALGCISAKSIAIAAATTALIVAKDNIQEAYETELERIAEDFKKDEERLRESDGAIRHRWPGLQALLLRLPNAPPAIHRNRRCRRIWCHPHG